MKRVVVLLALLLVVVFCFFCFFYKSEESGKESKATTVNITAGDSKTTEAPETPQKKIYAIWLTYSEIGDLVKNKSEEEYRKSLQEIFYNLQESKINTVFYQCRAFCDSLYNSEIFPVSKYLCAEHEAPTFDPLKIFIQLGKENGVSVHCWVNPYRVSYDKEFKNLPENSPARALYNEDKASLILCDKGIFLNPAHFSTRKLVLQGVKEILEKYQVQGIHFDDYFYPEAEKINDKKLYSSYTDGGGLLSLDDWRRENVSALVSSVYSLIKTYDENLIFSISPSADIEKCENVFYADVEKWCSEEGFADFIIPQIYYGFENEEKPFQKVFEEWSALGGNGGTKLICGLAAYKCGREDSFAGNGKNEWTENVNILKRQYEQVLKSQTWQGFSLFSYSYAFGENIDENSKKEIKNLLHMVE